jgi:hypothetical protein
MARKKVFPYSLDSGGITHLEDDEIDTILRAADSLIAGGGRTLLAKILRGSKEKKLISLGLETNPAYGAFSDRPAAEVANMIDRCILDGFMRIEFEGRMPVLVYTEKGWDRERELFADELYRQMVEDIEQGRRTFIDRMVAVNPVCVLIALKRLDVTAHPNTAEALKEWLPRSEGKVKKKLRNILGIH